MGNLSMKKVLASSILICVASTGFASNTQELIPGNGSLYYQVGGGDVTPLPYDSGEDIDLNVGGNASLGFNCGSFNPTASIMNNLNGLKNSFGDISNQIYHNLTGMIIGEGGYLLAKNMPNVYKYMRDGMSFGQHQFSLDTKSCETMLSEVDQGKNPGKDWMTASMGQDWQKQMSLAGSQADSDGILGSSSGDIVQAKSKINQDAGKTGVQWVQGKSINGQLMAGGTDGQPVIELTFDTVVAGYNVLIGNNRQYNDQSAPEPTPSNQGITSIFSSPVDAAKWAEYVIGENTITTYTGGTKKSTPGKGLLHYIQAQTQTISPVLSNLVEGTTPITLKNLQKLDSPKITINPGVIHAIQKLNNPTLEAIWVNRISQGISANRVINKAQLLRQFLLVGSQVPAIEANSAAQKGIQSDINHLNLFMKSVRSGPGDTQEFLAGSISDLLRSVDAVEAANASTQPSAPTGPVMNNGAIRTGGGN